MKELIRPELITMKSYTPIEPMDILSQRAELSVEGIIKLDGNENLYGCSPKVYQALANYPYYYIYPDPEQRRLRQALEEYTGLNREHIVCGSGSDEIIDLILRLFLKPGDKVINCPPTFGMYPFSTEVCGGKVVDIFPTEIASYLMKIKQPYNVNVAAQAAALASLADIDYLRANVAKIFAERERLFNKLKELEWLKPYPSSANFILCSLHCHSEGLAEALSKAKGQRLRSLAEESPAKEIWRKLQKRGIFVRYFDSPQLRNYLRISVGKPEDTDALIGALKEIKSKGVQKWLKGKR